MSPVWKRSNTQLSPALSLPWLCLFTSALALLAGALRSRPASWPRRQQANHSRFLNRWRAEYRARHTCCRAKTISAQGQSKLVEMTTPVVVRADEFLCDWASNVNSTKKTQKELSES